MVIWGFTWKKYVNEIYIDNNISIDIMYKHLYRQLLSQVERKIEPPKKHLICFVGYHIWPKAESL